MINIIPKLSSVRFHNIILHINDLKLSKMSKHVTKISNKLFYGVDTCDTELYRNRQIINKPLLTRLYDIYYLAFSNEGC